MSKGRACLRPLDWEVLGYHCFAMETRSLISLVGATEKGAIQVSISLYAIGSTFGFLLVYLLGGLDLFLFASQPYPRPLYFSYVVKNKTRNHCRKRVLGLLPCLPATNSSLFSCTGDHESWGNSFSTFSLWRLYRTDRRSFCGFFFHLPKMLQKSMPEIILLLLVMCNF